MFDIINSDSQCSLPDSQQEPVLLEVVDEPDSGLWGGSVSIRGNSAYFSDPSRSMSSSGFSRSCTFMQWLGDLNK